MNIWHDIDPSRINPEDFVAIVEISKNSKNKYELDKETGLLSLDRVLYTSTHYPANYGFIPRTYADDNDPLDVLVLCSEPIVPLSLVRCYPVGVVSMRDNGYIDDKIIAIPFEDPNYNHIRDIGAIPQHTLNEFVHFFTVYKTLENKVTADIRIEGRSAAINIIKHDLKRYLEIFGSDNDQDKKDKKNK